MGKRMVNIGYLIYILYKYKYIIVLLDHVVPNYGVLTIVIHGSYL